MDLDLFRYSRSIYGGSDVLIGASWDLLPWFVGAAFAFITLHALIKAALSKQSGAPRGHVPQVQA